jgi:hypothetical protein
LSASSDVEGAVVVTWFVVAPWVATWFVVTPWVVTWFVVTSSVAI